MNQLEVNVMLFVCFFSSGLKLLVTPVLAGLLENNPAKVWDFTRFYREVKRITQMKVNIFLKKTF